MSIYQKKRQFRIVLAAELVLIAVIFLLAYAFWQNVCSGALNTCLGDNPVWVLPKFFLLTVVRPFVFTPISLLPVMAGNSFGVLLGGLLNACGAVLSGLIVFLIARLVGKKMISPWLKRNLPQTDRLLRAQDYKIVLLFRLIPFVPFDLCSLAFGFLTFRVKHFVIFTFIGILPESFLIAYLAHDNENYFIQTVLVMSILTLMLLIPALLYELLSKKTTLLGQMKDMYRELLNELKENNELIQRAEFSSKGMPVLLLYGFFSSRNSLTILERILTSRGHDVLSFNLGGLFGAFSTESIVDTAMLIDEKLNRMFERHGFTKINIVAHSKGGLVALWWLLKMGGARHCDKIITMGTPFKGTKLTYIALITPMGLVWHDLWQMRPQSLFLKSLHDSSIPPELKVYCMHSLNDSVAVAEDGIFIPRAGKVTPVAMNHVYHLEFLNRRDVGDMISVLLNG